MREGFVHEAELSWDGSADERAPGGAVTEELCGSIDHEPPCPLAAHHSSVLRRGPTLEVRVLFACEPDAEPDVRERIDLGTGPTVAGARQPGRHRPTRRARPCRPAGRPGPWNPPLEPAART